MRGVPLGQRSTELQEAGFVICSSFIDEETTRTLREAVDDVIEGRFRTGRQPRRAEFGVSYGEVPQRDGLVKVSEPQWADERINSFIGAGTLQSAACALLKCDRMDVWTVDLIAKRPRSGARSRIGWHRDAPYMDRYCRGLAITAWLALDDMGPSSGALSYIAGSHAEDSTLPDGTFYDDNPSGHAFAGSAHVAVCPAGTVIFHLPRVVHGSRSNASSSSRRALAFRLRHEAAIEGPSTLVLHGPG